LHLQEASKQRIPKGDVEAAHKLCQQVQEAVEGKLAAHFSKQVVNDRIFQDDFDFNKDWQHHEASLNAAGGHSGKVLARKGSKKAPQKKQLRRRLSSVQLNAKQLDRLRNDLRLSKR